MGFCARLSGGKEGVGGRNCRPTATARRAVWVGTLRPERQGHTTSSNGGTNRSEVGLEIFCGEWQKVQRLQGDLDLVPHHAEGSRMMGRMMG